MAAHSHQYSMHTILGILATHIIPSQHTIRELQRPDHDEEEHEGVDEFYPLRRLVDVVVPDSQYDLLRILAVSYRGGDGGRSAVGFGGLAGGCACACGGGRFGRGRLGCCLFLRCHCWRRGGWNWWEDCVCQFATCLISCAFLYVVLQRRCGLAESQASKTKWRQDLETTSLRISGTAILLLARPHCSRQRAPAKCLSV